MTTTFATRIADKIKDVLQPRDHIVAELRTLAAQHAAAGAQRQRALADAEAAAAKLRDVLDAPARLRAAAYAAGFSEARALAEAERQLRENPSRELVRFEALLDRILARLRAGAPPSPVEEHNAVLSTVKVTNIEAIARHLALGGLISRFRVECRDNLWKLDSAALSARLKVLRQELQAACEGTALEHELS
jgi:hypothetical protein